MHDICIICFNWRRKLILLFCRKALPRNEKGWILIDALIGVTILAVAITAGIMMAQQTTVNTKYNANYAKAVLLAQREMEALKQSQDGTAQPLILSEWPKTEISTASPHYPEYTITVTSPAVSPPHSNLAPVEVRVDWMEASLNNRQMRVTVKGYRIQNY